MLIQCHGRTTSSLRVQTGTAEVVNVAGTMESCRSRVQPDTSSMRNRTSAGISAVMSLCVVLIGSGSALFAQPAPAGGNSYTWSTIDASYQDRRFLTAQKLAKSQVLFGKQSESASGNALSNWYRKYAFPRLASRDELGDPAKLREELLKDLNTTKDAKLHQTLVDLAFDEATKLAQGNFHPTIRFNALLIVGSLNRTESRLVGKDRFPATRLARALDFLVQEIKKPNSPDALRLAAMLGIARHVRLDRQRPQDEPIPEAQKAEIVSLAEAIVNQKEPGPNQEPKGHTWFRCRAVDLLATVGAVGTNLSVFNSVTALVTDSALPMSLRCTAAEAIGSFEYTNVAGIDPVAVSRQLGSLAASACRSIDVRVKEEMEKKDKTGKKPGMGGAMGGMGGMMGGMGGMMGAPEGMMGGSGGMMGGPEGMMGGSGGMMGGSGGNFGGGSRRDSGDSEPDADIQRARRRLKLPLRCVLIGLQGEMQPKASSSVASFQTLAQDDAQKAEIAEIVKAVDALVDATDLYEDGLEEMMKEVRIKTRELETLLPKSKTPEVPAASADRPGSDRPGG